MKQQITQKQTHTYLFNYTFNKEARAIQWRENNLFKKEYQKSIRKKRRRKKERERKEKEYICSCDPLASVLSQMLVIHPISLSDLCFQHQVLQMCLGHLHNRVERIHIAYQGPSITENNQSSIFMTVFTCIDPTFSNLDSNGFQLSSQTFSLRTQIYFLILLPLNIYYNTPPSSPFQFT